MNAAVDDISITYPVQRSHIERALDILGQAQRTTRRFYRFLIGASLAFAITLALFALSTVFRDILGEATFDILLGFLIVLVLLAAFLLVMAFLSNLPRMGMQWWFSRRLGKLGLGEIAVTPPSTLRARSLEILGTLGTVIGVLFLMLFVVLVVGSTVDPDEFQGLGSELKQIILFAVFLGIGLLLTVPHFISRRRRSRKLIHRIEGLRKQLSEYLSEATARASIDVPVEDLNLMASIEGAQIERDRAEAIVDARREARPDDYVLLNSRRAMEVMKSLEPEVRVRVQERAAALTRAVKPSNATGDESADVWRLAVPDTQVELRYHVDKEKHQIKILSVDDLKRGLGIEAPYS